jgi:hypothetical protein
VENTENFRWSMAPTVAQGMAFEHKEQIIAEGSLMI